MTGEEKLMWLFEQVHGKIGGTCSTEVVVDDLGNCVAVNVMKYGNACSTEVVVDDLGNCVAVNVMKYGIVCWTATKLDLVFDYLTRNL